MKKMIFILAAACAAAAFADVEPAPQTCAEWQAANAAAIADATSADSLKAATDRREAADALLSAVKPGFGTDPLAATRIAAVTQYVMDPANAGCCDCIAFWRTTLADRRKIWAAALLAAAQKADDAYVATFLVDQLRWCGFAGQAGAVAALGKKRGGKLAAFAEMAADELRGCAAPDRME